MSDDLLRTARQMLAELAAHEGYLRSIAFSALPYARIMAAERHADRRAAELLANLGLAPVELQVDDATDELLLGRGRARPVPEPSAPARPTLARAESVGPPSAGYEALDDGPEGAADASNDLRSDETAKRPTGRAAAKAAPASASATASATASARAAKAPAPAASAASPPSYVVYDEEPGDEATVREKRNPSGQVSPRSAPRIEAKGKDPKDKASKLDNKLDDLDALVTFEAAPTKDTPATVARTVAPPKAAKGKRGSEGSGSDTFDLIPDLSDEPNPFDDEEVTVVKAAESVAWETTPSPPPKAGRPVTPSTAPTPAPSPSASSASSAAGAAGAAAGAAVSAAAAAAARRKATPAPPPSTSSATSAPSTSSAASARAPSVERPPSRDRSSSAPVPTARQALAASKAAQSAAPAATRSDATRSDATRSDATRSDARSEARSEAREPARPSPRAVPSPVPASPRASASPSRAPTPVPSSPPARPSTPSGDVNRGRPSPSRGGAAAVPTAAARTSGRSSTPAPSTAPGAGGSSSRVTAGLYGGGSVPTIREGDDPRPRAAAIQLNPSGSGARVIGLEEEEEPIEIGEADGYEDDAYEGSGGFSVRLREDGYDDEDEYEDEAAELSEEDLEVIQPAGPPPKPTADEVQAMMNRAQQTAVTGDLQGSADLYSDVIDVDPDNVPAHVARGRLYLDLGDYSRAMSDFMVAEGIAPDDPEPQVATGDLYFARKDYRKAIDYFNAALQVAPNHAMAFCRRGISHYYRKNYKEAVDDLLKAERIDRDIPNIQTFVSMARKKLRK